MDSTVVAQILGMFSFTLGIAVFYQKNDKHLKIMMLIFNLNHLIHFVLLGSIVSALAALLSALRTATAIYISSKYVAAAFIVISAVFGYWIADEWQDLWPILGMVIGTYSIFCLTGISMRLGFLIGAFCWLINNIIVGSIGGTLLEATLIVMNAITIFRLQKQELKVTESKSAVQR